MGETTLTKAKGRLAKVFAGSSVRGSRNKSPNLDNLKRRSRRFPRTLLPAIVFLGLFYAYPFLDLTGRSVEFPDVTADYYLQFLQNSNYVDILTRTLLIAALGTLTCIIVGYPLAYTLAQAAPRLRNLLLVAVIAPWLMSSLIRTIAWVLLLSKQGPINDLLVGSNLLQQPITFIGNSTAVYIGLVHVHLPFGILPMYAVMQRIDNRLILVAKGSGANPMRAFYHVYLPLSSPGVAGAGVLLYISMLGFYITPLLLGGPGDLFIANLIDLQVRQLVNWELAAAMGFVLVGAVIILLFFYSRLFDLKTLLRTEVE